MKRTADIARFRLGLADKAPGFHDLNNVIRMNRYRARRVAYEQSGKRLPPDMWRAS